MDTPQKRQKSWFSSLTGLVAGSRVETPETVPSTSSISSAMTNLSVRRDAASSGRLTRLPERTPARNPGTFSAPPVDSPESPVKRASPARLAQRKMHDRAQGPSGRMGFLTGNAHGDASTNIYAYNTESLGRATATPKRRTNFSSSTTSRNMFRDTLTRDMPSFSFTPRVPPNTMRGSFPAVTPGRSLRAPGAELGTRDMDKVAPTEHFAMKIPDPDPELTGEAISKMVPAELKGTPEGMYANHFLAHLCPPEFTEEQRNQFFCILDLRRLKYGANNVFAKQDWKLNIANFAKEYEKSRSMILLRYGLYTFKTVKVSQDVFDKWRSTNDVPDDKGEADDAASPDAAATPKPNGTEGILRGKRKAQDNIDPSATPGTKRSRALDGSKTTTTTAERDETSTPAQNKPKRKATRTETADQLQRTKMQKPAQSGTPAAAPSATKAFFEKVANTPSKETSKTAAETPSIEVSKPTFEGSASAAPSSQSKPSSLAPSSKPAANGSLARSVLENGLKSSSAATTTSNSNIFGYLSDASSAKGSGNDNADADGEDTDGSDDQEASDGQSAAVGTSTSTPAPAASLFAAKPAASSLTPAVQAAAGSGASSDASDSGTGRSLFDRVNKGSDGQPLRAFGSEGASLTSKKPDAAPSLFGSKPPSARASPEKETPSLFAGNKTWTPDSPIKFAGGASSTPASKPLFGAASSTTPAVSSPFKFGPSATTTTPAPAADKPASTEKAPDAAPAAASSTPLFGFLNKPADATSTAPAAASTSSQPAVPSLFAKPAAPATTTAPASAAAAATTAPAAAPSLFGSSSSTPAMPSSTLFGNAPTKPDAPSFGSKRSAEDDTAFKATPSVTNGANSLFGSTKNNGTASGDEPQAKKALFGSGASTSTPAPAASTSAPLFSFGSTTNGDAAKPAAPALFGAAATSSTPAAPKTGNLFGNPTTATTTPAPAASGSLFSFGSTTPATTTAAPASGSLFSFGSSTAAPTQPSGGLSFGGGNGTASAGTSFNFSAGGAAPGAASQSFRNPFASGGDAATPAAPTTFSFGAGTTNGQSSGAAPSSLFQFGSSSSAPAAAPGAGTGSMFSFGGGSQTTEAATTPGNSFSSAAPASNGLGSSTMFSFGGAGGSQPSSSTPLFGAQPASGGSMFNLAPMGATTGTNTPSTKFGGASTLATTTTPATGTPEPGATQKPADNSGHQADGDEAPQEQISLTEGGPGEEDEAVVYEVRAKALKLATKDESESESPGGKEKKSPWKTEGVGPLRILKNKASGAVRLLLRAEPRGHVALNRALLPDFTYKPEPNAKYVKLTTANATGTGLETWMLQVKTKEAAKALADALEENKLANKK